MSIYSNVSALFDPWARYRSFYPPNVVVVSDSTYNAHLEARKQEQIAELRATAASLRDALAAVESKIEALGGSKPDG